jgi:multidrug efflux pump subunit AcrA (membrane-fusion protein)
MTGWKISFHNKWKVFHIQIPFIKCTFAKTKNKMNWRKSIISVVAVIILLVAAFALNNLFSSFGEAPEESSREEIKLFVKAEKVEYSTNKASIIEMGRLASQQSVNLSAEVQGQIIQGDVNLREGTSFRKGDLLVKIFDEDAKNNLKASKSRFLNSIAGILPDIKIDYPESFDKYMKFFNAVKIDEPLPPLPKLDSEKEKVFLASRNILNDYYNIKSAEVRLSRYKVYAPFEGTFTMVFLEPGSVANPGARIASMIRTDKLELEVPVRSDDAYWVNVNDKVKVSTKDRLTSWTGRVVRKSSFMDPNTQTISIYVSLEPEKNKPLYQGQFLLAEFSSKTHDESMVIPRNAIFKKDKVFVVESGKLKEQKIDILRTNETTVLFSGLPVGVDVVVEPLVNAKEGANAEILN